MPNDDLKGLPDVDLSPVLNDLKNQEKDEQRATDTKTQTKTDGNADLGQFKTPEDLLKGYKEIQGFSTKVSQKNKEMEGTIASLREEIDLLRNAATSTHVPQGPARSFDESFLQDPAGTIGSIVTQQVMTSRIADVLEEEQVKDADSFQERYAYAQAVAREYPNLATTPAGVRKLFEKGDKLRASQLRKNAGRALETIFGEPLGDEEISNLRSLVKGKKDTNKTNNNLNAYMPDISTSTKTGSDTGRTLDRRVLINDSVEKGDVDGVLKNLFDEALAE